MTVLGHSLIVFDLFWAILNPNLRCRYFGEDGSDQILRSAELGIPETEGKMH